MLGCSSEENVSALQFASIVGRTRIAEILIHSGCSIDHHSFNGFTPLHYAAKHGHVDITKLLIDEGYAYPVGIVMTQWLFDRADINARSDKLHTPLSLAVKFGHLGVVKALIAKGANLETVKNKVCPCSSSNCIHRACRDSLHFSWQQRKATLL